MTGRPPIIIIIGMHRSGTSMVTRALQQLGLFVGWRRDPNDEALLFLQLNEWLLRQAGAAWDNPTPIRGLLADETLRQRAVEALRRTVNRWPALGYLGPKRFLRYRTPMALTDPWGWKDPRNTLTYPLWLDLFPEAKILHITRHGMDVANSLATRETHSPGIGNLTRVTFLGIYGGPEIPPSRRCRTLDNALLVWEEYLTIANENQVAINGDLCRIRYEDFLENPEQYLTELAEFCELQTSEAAIGKVCSTLKPARAFAYRGNSELENFAASASERLGRHGY